VGGLLAAHALLLGLSIPRNSVTVDEFVHLPAGISYWHCGRFWAYHHNPPFIRLVCAVPAVVADVPTDYRNYFPVNYSRYMDGLLGDDFMWANGEHYMEVFIMCRFLVVGFSLLGGWLIFRWSGELFGATGGVLSLGLWVFCPNVLAHAGLVTTDIGATVLGLGATYWFWKYLRRPSFFGSIISGTLLGLTEASKFSFIVLPLVWAAVAVLRILRPTASPMGGSSLTWLRASVHAVNVGVVSVLVLNSAYLWEGTFQPLESFPFRSNALSRLKDRGNPSVRENRFRGTLVGNVPVPLPQHYVLGIDDQKFDIDSRFFCKYLRGERRGSQEPGWWYYYLYCLLVKTPLGTLVIVVAAVAAFIRTRMDALLEATLLLPAAAILISVSSQTGLNSHLRYVLPALPFLFVFAGRVGRLVEGRPIRLALLALVLGSNLVSVLRAHPHYLSYFNEAAGGPQNGWRHLADSNIDWGEGLIVLREWLQKHAPGERLALAYFGFAAPEVYGIVDYKLPPFRSAAPGLHAVSANYLIGIPFTSPDGNGGSVVVPEGAYTYFRSFEPVARVGGSIWIFRISNDHAQRLRGEFGSTMKE
jgi:hypothetical protein